MEMSPLFVFCIMLAEFFGLGLLFGEGIARRNPPNEPKPKKWSDMLQKEFMRGYDAGVKATLNQMKVEIKKSDARRG